MSAHPSFSPVGWWAGGPVGRRQGQGAGARALAILAALLLVSAVAHGDTLTEGDRPWQRGVSSEHRAAAEREFLAGNRLFERSEYAAAAARYRQAIATWAHPSIQFNLAVCLFYLDRPVEAYDTLQASLRFGRDGLRDHFDEANNYLRLLRDRISTLEVELPAGARVPLDGEPLVAIDGKVVRRRLSPGRHALVARKPRFETWSKDLVLPPGEVTREVIVLRAPRTKTVRRWSAVMPWWVAGAGMVAAGAGAAALMVGNADQRAVTAAVAQRCPPPAGCPDGLPKGLSSEEARARLTQRLGVSLMATGAAVVVTGVVLLVLNQPRQVLESSGLSVQVSSQDVALGWSHAF